MDRADSIKARLDIPTVAGWYGVNWDGRGKTNCPLCGSKAFNLIKNDRGAFFCHKCEKGGDVIKFIQHKENMATPGEAMAFIEARIGGGKPSTGADNHRPKDAAKGAKLEERLERCRKAYPNSKGAAYMAGRGISGELAAIRQIGFDPAFPFTSHAKETGGQTMTGEFILIPYGNGYLARNINPDADHADRIRYPWKFKPSETFYPDNWKTLLTDSTEPVFIVESITDALSFEEIGAGIARSIEGERGTVGIALGGTSGAKHFLDELETMKKAKKEISAPLILIPDEDDNGAGVKNWDDLAEGLRRIEVDYCYYRDKDAPEAFNILRGIGAKDTNAALVKDRATLQRNIYAAERAAPDEPQRKRAAARAAYLAQAAGSSASMKAFDKYLKDRANRPHISTGIKQLDELLGGGLDERLYIVAAASSYGKTSFCLQMAETIAADGTDVLFFALEMGRQELIAKGISRRSYLNAEDTDADGRPIVRTRKRAATAQEILDSAKTPPGANRTGEDALIKDDIEKLSEYIATARTDYAKDAANLYFVEVGVGTSKEDERLTVDFIRDEIKRHIAETNEPDTPDETKRKPVVIIDYLQLLEPAHERDSDKQNMDYTSKQLRRIVRKERLPLIAISSIGRGAYYTPISKESLKESGNIEFTADVIIGIQARGLLLKAAQSNSKDEEKTGKECYDVATDRDQNKAELVIVKNRGGVTSGTIADKDNSDDSGKPKRKARDVVNLVFKKRFSHFIAVDTATHTAADGEE